MTVPSATASTYLDFVREEEAETGKTQVWAVTSKRHGFTLGMIRWYGAWRQYVFYPAAETLFNTGCLHDIDNFLESLMYQWLPDASLYLWQVERLYRSMGRRRPNLPLLRLPPLHCSVQVLAMTVPSATSRTTNVAADDLRAAIKALPTGRFAMLADLDAALSEERRLTVDAIRERTGKLPEYEGDIVPVLDGMTRLLQALDEIGGSR